MWGIEFWQFFRDTCIMVLIESNRRAYIRKIKKDVCISVYKWHSEVENRDVSHIMLRICDNTYITRIWKSFIFVLFSYWIATHDWAEICGVHCKVYIVARRLITCCCDLWPSHAKVNSLHIFHSSTTFAGRTNFCVSTWTRKYFNCKHS